MERWENTFGAISGYDFKKERVSLLEKGFENFIKVTRIYYEVVLHFAHFLDLLISEKGILPREIKYKTVLDTTTLEKLHSLGSIPVDKEIQRYVEEYFQEMGEGEFKS